MTAGAACLRFGPFELDQIRLQLRVNGERVPIAPKPLAVLLYLVLRRGQTISREELLREVWPGVTVEDGALKSAVHGARRALAAAEGGGSASEGERWILGVHGSGYRFVGSVELISASNAMSSRMAVMRPGEGSPPSGVRKRAAASDDSHEMGDPTVERAQAPEHLDVSVDSRKSASVALSAVPRVYGVPRGRSRTFVGRDKELHLLRIRWAEDRQAGQWISPRELSAVWRTPLWSWS